jgi:thiol-disulfide isomerase/thioredoxin
MKKFVIVALEVAVFVALFFAVTAWQTRNLLATDRQAAPALVATSLQGQVIDIADSHGRPALVYFFAPWCPYCSASADNLVRLRKMRDVDELEILIVALDWESKDQIQQYANEHELNVPVLLGDSAIWNDWKVRGFPTYYVLDREHRVVRRDFGYSTQFGLWWRTWMTG